MEKALKKLGQKSRDFVDLPMRVVIHDILPFYFLEIPPSSFDGGRIDPFLLFGYFTKDRFRHIWVVCHSIHVNCWAYQFKRRGFILPLARLEYLEIYRADETLINELFKKGNTMKKLKKLDFTRSVSLMSLSKSVFVDNNHFPSLEYFQFRADLLELFESDLNSPFFSNWPESSIFCQLKVFKFRLDVIYPDIGGEKYRDLKRAFPKLEEFFTTSNGRFQNLETLHLGEIQNTGPTIELNLPKLKNLKLDVCWNIRVVSGIGIEDLTLNRCSDDVIRGIFLGNLKLRNLSFSRDNFNRSEIIFKILKDNNFQNLQNLKMTTWGTSDNSWENILSSSRKLCLLDITFTHLNNNFFKNDFKFVKKLHFYHVEAKKVTLFRSAFAKYVEVLKIRDCNDFSDDFFSLNDWSSLLDIQIDKVTGIRGKGWKSDTLRRVRKLQFRHVHFSDELFQTLKFDHLENLSLRWNNCAYGRGWDPSVIKNLKTLQLLKMNSLTDEIFQKNNFFRLKNLKIDNCSCLKGLKWTYETFKNLEFLDVKKASLKAFSGNPILSQIKKYNKNV